MAGDKRAIAHFLAHQLTLAIVRADTCTMPFVADTRAADVDQAFRDLAAALGYTVTAAPAKTDEVA